MDPNAQPGGGEGQREQDELAFDLESAIDIPQMWVDKVERLRASDADFAGVLPLHFAVAASGRADVVQFMLDRGYDKDVLDDKGHTPLHGAAMGGHMDMVVALLAAGADVSARTNYGKSVLDLAAEGGHVDIALAIMEHGADVNAAGADGKTALHRAALADQADMVSMLCLKGAAIAALDADGETPIQCAALARRMAATLALAAAGPEAALRWKSGFSVLAWGATHGHVDVLRAVVKYEIGVNAADSACRTPLYMAAFMRKPAAIDVLVQAGADIEKGDGRSRTPLHVAAQRGGLTTVLTLLGHGARIDKRDWQGGTTLHTAAAKAGIGTAAVVDLLLRRGADEKATNNDGQTPADVIGSEVYEHETSLTEDVERVRQLLANAPADRAWRRRGFLVLCRAHYPAGRVQLGQGSSPTHASIANRTHSHPEPWRADIEWADVASMLIGAGTDPISRMGGGADLIFETIVGFV